MMTMTSSCSFSSSTRRSVLLTAAVVALSWSATVTTTHGFQPANKLSPPVSPSSSSTTSTTTTTTNKNVIKKKSFAASVTTATAATVVAMEDTRTTTRILSSHEDEATVTGATLAPTATTNILFPPQPSTTTKATTTAAAATAAAAATLSLINSPAEAFELLVQKGEANAAASIPKTLLSSMLGGAYVGMGAMLSLQVAGNAPSLDYGLDKLLFAVLFPVNLLLALQCGGQLFTGNTATMMAAVCERRATYDDLGKSWMVSLAGNAIGCISFALLCQYAGVYTDGAYHLAATTLAAKTSSDFGPTLVKAIFANWLVCLAVFLNLQAKDLTGKYLAVLLPVSAFVAMGFEHSVANLFLLPAGLLSPYHDPSITWQTVLLQNLLPVTIGNAVSGSYLVGAAFSYLYGTLGQEEHQQQEEAEEMEVGGMAAMSSNEIVSTAAAAAVPIAGAVTAAE